MNKFIWKLYAAYSHYCKYRLQRIIPNFNKLISDYSARSDTTGTKYPTLYYSVRSIIKRKPSFILESGTGTSTLILAELVLRLQEKDPSYHCKIISMESVLEWYELAVNLLPKRYHDIVEIRFGEREKYEYSIFRGYVHSNIPTLPFDFVLVDGPNYNDENGSSTCMDAIKARQISEAKNVFCVVDTRVSTVFMMQQIFSKKSNYYFPFLRTCLFTMPKIRYTPKLDSESFHTNIWGKVALKMNSLLDTDFHG